VDLHEMISRYGEKIDWEKLAELTRKYRIKRPVYYALFFTKNMFGTPVPGYILQSLKKTRPKIDPWIFKKIKSGNTGGDYFAELAMFDSTADMARFIFSSIVTYPYKIFDFFRIFLRMMKKIVSAS
jgi:hypothetical protein